MSWGVSQGLSLHSPVAVWPPGPPCIHVPASGSSCMYSRGSWRRGRWPVSLGNSKRHANLQVGAVRGCARGRGAGENRGSRRCQQQRRQPEQRLARRKAEPRGEAGAAQPDLQPRGGLCHAEQGAARAHAGPGARACTCTCLIRLASSSQKPDTAANCRKCATHVKCCNVSCMSEPDAIQLGDMCRALLLDWEQARESTCKP